MLPKTVHIDNNLPPADTLYQEVRDILQAAQKTAYKAVNFAMVAAYWQIGKVITEDELQNKRAAYGKAVLQNLSIRLTEEFGKGFDERELRKMCQFYRLFPIRDTLRPELSWSHYRKLLTVNNPDARTWYMNEAIARYSVLNDAKQIFASRYTLYLPTEEELKQEIEREQKRLEKN